jgi:hypothetical protein
MSSTVHQPPLKMTATMAAADPNCTAVALAELPAAFVSFQRSAPSLPPTKNVHSAASPVLPAARFSGNIAIFAVYAGVTATNGSPLGQHLQHLEHLKWLKS